MTLDYHRMVGSDIEVFTGTLGQLSYTSDSGQKVKLFLGAQGSTPAEPTVLPVPEFYWKVVHDPLSGDAVVFVGLNDPYFEGDPSVDAQICPDVCESGLWFFAHRKDVARGYTYCCTYQEFAAVVEWAPDIGSQDPGLLRNRLI